ncbi:MAG: hypothetical protein SP1CHLAM54_02250 [Chlamydiia bacterium]|nr:hypothetical protein [Chlamydiia bacterium]MCH9615142.1 hypothetical protein [Chlamydiia bacterium]MCH9628536.1 hypothetical protein [Chlamydiia bacterium]
MAVTAFISNNPALPFRYLAFAAHVMDMPTPVTKALKDAVAGAYFYDVYQDFAQDTVKLVALDNAVKCLGKLAQRCDSLGLCCLGAYLPYISVGTKAFSIGGNLYKLKVSVDKYCATSPDQRDFSKVACKLSQTAISFFSLATVFFPLYKVALNLGKLIAGTAFSLLKTSSDHTQKFTPESDAFGSLRNI